jgi:hypothetical protein
MLFIGISIFRNFVVLSKRTYELSQGDVGDLINSANTSLKKVKIGYQFPIRDHSAVVVAIAAVTGVAYSFGIV